MLANPRKSKNKSKEYRLQEKISEKVKSVFSVQSVFKFLSIAAGWWTYSLIYYSVCRCVPSLRQGHKSKKWNTDSTDFTRISLFTDSFFWFYFGQWCFDFGVIYLDLQVLEHFLFGVWRRCTRWNVMRCFSEERECPSTRESTKIQN